MRDDPKEREQQSLGEQFAKEHIWERDKGYITNDKYKRMNVRI